MIRSARRCVGERFILGMWAVGDEVVDFGVVNVVVVSGRKDLSVLAVWGNVVDVIFGIVNRLIVPPFDD